MPICQFKTNFNMSDKLKKDFSDAVAFEIADILKKPIPAVMISISNEFMQMNGSSSDTVFFAEFRFVMEFDDENNKKIFLKNFSDRTYKVIKKFINVDKNRIYMQFTFMPRDCAWKCD